MARPQKQTVDYFPHDSRASDGTTLTILDSKFGNDGYSFWFRLLERLAASPGHYIDCRVPAVWEFLQAKTHLSDDTVCSILKLLAELGAIDKQLWESKVIWCQNLVDNIADVYNNRRTETPQKPNVDGNNPSGTVVSTDDNPSGAVVSTAESTQTKLKETKLKETKLNKDTPYSFNKNRKDELISGQSVEKAIRIAQGKLEASPRNRKTCQAELDRRGIRWRERKGAKSGSR